MPPAAAWIAIAIVVVGVLAVLWTAGRLLSKVLP
jgi:hypothetical protein